MVSFFEGSVAGLRVGAPVTYRGVRVGEVKAIDVRFNPNEQDTVIQVGMELFPETVTLTGGGAPLKDEDLVPDLVRRGLTARLVLESFVTRLLSVDLDFRPGAHVSRRGEPGSAAGSAYGSGGLGGAGEAAPRGGYRCGPAGRPAGVRVRQLDPDQSRGEADDPRSAAPGERSAPRRELGGPHA